MIFLKAPKAQLSSALQTVMGVVERRSTLPILANVLVRKNNHSVQLIAGDMQVQLCATAELGGDDGTATTTVGAHKLVDVLRSISAEQTVSIEEQDARLVLKAGKSKFTLQTMPADDFPLMKEAEGFGEAFSVPQKTLKEHLDRVAFAMANSDDLRYYLQGVLFEAEGTKLVLVATDGHRLAMSQAQLETPVTGKQSVILSRKTVFELQRLLSDASVPEGEQAPMIEIRFSASQAKFRFANVEFVSTLVEGKYPDYARALPTETQHGLTLGREAFLAGVQRVASLNNAKNSGVQLTFETGVLRLKTVNADQEEAEDEIDVDYDGGRFEVGFNYNYLIDVLTHLPQEMLRIDMQEGSTGSAVLTVPGDENYKYVVMPLRL